MVRSPVGGTMAYVLETGAAGASHRCLSAALRPRPWVTCARMLRASALLLQHPRSFRPTDGNVARLTEFCRQIEEDAYVLFDNIPRVIDAERFRTLLR